MATEINGIVWLTKEELSTSIGESLPESFPFKEKMLKRIENLIGEWLTDLIGSGTVDNLQSALNAQIEGQTLSENDQAWMQLIKPFLALAAWSDYVNDGNVSYTLTGPVTKQTSQSIPIDPDQREAIARKFMGRAKTWAVRIAKKASETNTCSGPTSAGSGRVSASVIRSKHRSYFDDFR